MRKLLAIAIIFASISSAMLAQTARVYFDAKSFELNPKYCNQLKSLVQSNTDPIELFTYINPGANIDDINLSKHRTAAVIRCIKQCNARAVIKTSTISKRKSKLPTDSLNLCVDIFMNESTKSVVAFTPKTMQEFTINNSTDTTLVGNEGTKIHIPANCFVLANGKKITNSNYKVELKEYYKLSDMLMARLSTTANGHLLSTGGMLYIKVTNNDQECWIDSKKTIKLTMQNSSLNNHKSIYYGTIIQDIIDWKVPNYLDDFENKEVFVVVEESATFRGGDVNSFREYIQSKIKKTENENENMRKMVVHFIVNETGYIEQVEVLRGINPSLNYYVKNAIKASPQWEPARQGGKQVNQQITIPIFIDVTMKVDSVGEVGPSIAEINEKLKVKTYKTGWLNYNLQLNDRSTAMFTVETDMNLNAPFLIIKNKKAILPSTINKNNANEYNFANVPLNEEVTVFSLKIVNNEYFLVYGHANTSSKKIKLDFKKVDTAELKRALDELDK